MLVHGRRQFHGRGRVSIHARRTSAYCRRVNQREARQDRHDARHSQGWWKWYFSPRQVAKRKRRKVKALRRLHAGQRREKKYLHMAGKTWINYPACPSRVSAERKAATERRHKREAERRKARRQREARCRRAQQSQTSSKGTRAARAAKARKSSKSAKAKSGRSKC
jgi:hypothetical protein